MASTHAISASRMKELVNLYKTAAGYPFLKSMRVVGTEADRVFIQGWWSQRNLEMKTERRFLTNYYLNSDLTLVSTEFPVDCTTELMSSLTHDKRRQAVLRQVKEDTSTKQFIEIWEQSRIVKNYDLAALNVHGDVYTDVEFRSFEWSPDNTKLLYIAEKKQPKSEPFYKQKSLDEKNSKQDDEASVGNEYIYKPHWGEQYVGKHRPVVAILDTTTDSITILSGIPDELSPGQVLWTKGQDVIGVAWRHEPRHLGLVACTNRHSWIFLWKNGEYRKLSPDGHAVHSPRLSPDGSYLVWLQREAGVVPHHNAHALVMRDLRLAEDHIHEIVEVVRTSKEINNGRQFYGIYGRLPNRCWTEDSQYLIFSTPQKMNIVSYIVNLKTKAITEINNDRTSLMVGDVKDNIILFLHTSVNRPTGLIVGRFGSKAVEDGNVYLTSLTPLEFQVFKDIKLEPSDYSYDNDEEINQFNYIYVGPDSGEDKSVPMILIPHGGPHSNFANTFSLDSMFFALAGFAIVLVNYRGSTGMGSATVEYLQGRVGDVDVRDCITATQEALKKYPWLDPDRVGLCGGSHGGFLVAHLSAQAPDMFKAVVARNPVIDISIMVGTSDIPDCRNALTKEEIITYLRKVCAVEAGCPYDIIAGPQPDNMDIYVKMKKCSPIVHVDRVKAPTLICLGTKDLRVPPSQGAMWYHRLKANSVKTKMLVYEDNHQLGSGPVEIDNLINDCLWLLEHTSTRKASGEKE